MTAYLESSPLSTWMLPKVATIADYYILKLQKDFEVFLGCVD